MYRRLPVILAATLLAVAGWSRNAIALRLQPATASRVAAGIAGKRRYIRKSP